MKKDNIEKVVLIVCIIMILLMVLFLINLMNDLENAEELTGFTDCKGGLKNIYYCKDYDKFNDLVKVCKFIIEDNNIIDSKCK